MACRGAFLALILGGLGACADGNGGAVSIRWRIVDLTTGAIYDPGSRSRASGQCFCPPAAISGDCPGSQGWEVDRVRLRAVSLDGSGEEPAPDSLVFRCQSREATTPFNLHSGSWALSLEAFNLAGTFAGVTPPSVVRQVRASQIVNLDVIEIGVDPLPTPPFVPDGGASD